MLGSFERHLKHQNYNVSLIKGYEFSKCREILKCKQKDLKKQGKGNFPKRAEALTDDEVNELYEKELLGSSTPSSMLNTLWYQNTLHFGIRGGGEEHRQLQWHDIQLKHDSTMKLDYLEYNERQTKTRTGDDVRNIRESKPRAYEMPQNRSRCPVELYKAYREKRPNDYCKPNDPFYLAVVTNKSHPRPDEQWFLRGPVGKHKMNNLMKKMADSANLPERETKRITNTSVRKQLCQKLMDNDIPDEQAIHITGHKNTTSLNRYRTLNDKKRKQMSEILSNTDNSVNDTENETERNRERDMQPTFQFQHTATSRSACSISNIPTGNPSDIFHTIFYGSTINGGTFNVNINFATSPKRAKPNEN